MAGKISRYVAAALGLTRGHVDVLLHRAKASLLVCMTEDRGLRDGYCSTIASDELLLPGSIAGVWTLPVNAKPLMTVPRGAGVQVG
jgi:hypothetical protein